MYLHMECFKSYSR